MVQPMRSPTGEVRRNVVQFAEASGKSDVALVVQGGVAEDDDAVLYPSITISIEPFSGWVIGGEGVKNGGLPS
jgi:hypothetical protein